MANLYSALLYEVHDLSGTDAVFLDPAYVWVMRDIAVFFPGPDVECSLNVVIAATDGTVWACNQAAVDNPGIIQTWEGRQVIVPPVSGPTLLIKQSSEENGSDVRISGYRLTPP